jgi:hypothetical protein
MMGVERVGIIAGCWTMLWELGLREVRVHMGIEAWGDGAAMEGEVKRAGYRRQGCGEEWNVSLSRAPASVRMDVIVGGESAIVRMSGECCECEEGCGGDASAPTW